MSKLAFNKQQRLIPISLAFIVLVTGLIAPVYADNASTTIQRVHGGGHGGYGGGYGGSHGGYYGGHGDRHGGGYYGYSPGWGGYDDDYYDDGPVCQRQCVFGYDGYTHCFRQCY